MLRMKLLCRVTLLVSLCMLLPLVSTSASAAPELIPFYTPSAGGGAYILGAGIITVTNKYLPEIKLVQEATTGTMDIVRRMQARETAKKDCLGTFGTVDAWRAYKGLDEYSGKPFTGLRALTYILGTDLYFVVPTNSSVKSYADAKGKRIGVGGPGSTTANTALFLFEQHGVTKKDFKPQYYVFREIVEGIQNGSLDGGIFVGGYPIAAYAELSTQHNVRIVPLEDSFLKKVTAEHPYYYRTVIKAKAYKGHEQDTPILGFATAFYAHEGMSNDLVYKMMKNLWEHKTEYYAIHSAAKEMNVEDATKGITIPFHAGAVKYLKEIGAMK